MSAYSSKAGRSAWVCPWDDAESLEVPAIQHAYDILIDDGEEVFTSECQNKPIA